MLKSTLNVCRTRRLLHLAVWLLRRISVRSLLGIFFSYITRQTYTDLCVACVQCIDTDPSSLRQVEVECAGAQPAEFCRFIRRFRSATNRCWASDIRLSGDDTVLYLRSELPLPDGSPGQTDSYW